MYKKKKFKKRNGEIDFEFRREVEEGRMMRMEERREREIGRWRRRERGND